MPVLRSYDKQNAQGMVEFALVLPFLLLIIFGIFAFGHLFFTYSSVVIASREAARYGAAVGLSENGKPRYVDCAAIRQAAAGLGRFAGVTADAAHVEVLYDSGPDDSNAPRICTSSTDPSTIKLGDRIIVRTKVTYRPIVPLVNLPTIPLEAETKRTLIKELPVGQAPTAESPCQTSTTLNAVPEESINGQLVTFTASLTKIKGYSTNPAGRLKIMVDPAEGVQLEGCSAYVNDFVDGSGGVSFTNANPTFSTTCQIRFYTAGQKTISVNFDSTEVHSTCFNSTITDFAYNVGPANTRVSIDHPPFVTSESMKQVRVSVNVEALSPSNAIPSGSVRIYDPNKYGVSCEAEVGGDGTASCLINLPEDGEYRFKAEYTPDNPDDFNPSEKLADQSFTFPPEGEQPTLTPKPPTATNTPSPTPETPEPEPTQPSWCPTFPNGIVFNKPGGTNNDYFDIKVFNPGSGTVTISKIDVTWYFENTDPLLKEIRFGDNQLDKECSKNNNQCIWAVQTSGVEKRLVVPGPGQNFTGNSSNLQLSKSKEKILRFTFVLGLKNSPKDAYQAIVYFKNSSGDTCYRKATGTRNQ